jgi:hypothetical protein
VASGAGRAIGLLLGASAMGGMLCPPALLSAGLLLVYWAAAERLRMRQSAGQSLARPVVLFVLLVWMIDLQFLVVPGMPWQKLSLAFLGLAVVLIAWRTMLARGKGGTRPGAPGLVPPYRLLLPVQAAMALACPPPGWIVAMVLLLVWGGMVIRPLFGR